MGRKDTSWMYFNSTFSASKIWKLCYHITRPCWDILALPASVVCVDSSTVRHTFTKNMIKSYSRLCLMPWSVCMCTVWCEVRLIFPATSKVSIVGPQIGTSKSVFITIHAWRVYNLWINTTVLDTGFLWGWGSAHSLYETSIIWDGSNVYLNQIHQRSFAFVRSPNYIFTSHPVSFAARPYAEMYCYVKRSR